MLPLARKPKLALVVTFSLISFFASLSYFLLDDSVDQPTVLFLDGPDKAFIHNSYKIRDPHENRVPYERMLAAREQMTNAANRVDARDFNWSNINTTIPGRARAIHYHTSTQTLFSGSVTGGLWKNTDYKNNAKWENVSGFEGVAVNCIAADPNDANTLYLGTGESFTAFVNYRESTGVGNGIYKSSDGGVIWEWIDTTDGFYYINDLAVRNESGLSVLYAAVGSGEYRTRSFVQEGLYRSVDQGLNWTQVLPKIPNSDNYYQVSDIEIGSDGRIYLGTMRNAVEEGGSIVLYSDDAITWSTYTVFNEWVDAMEEKSYAGRSLLKVAPSNPNHVYAVFSWGWINNLNQLRDYSSELWHSTDGGTNWSQIHLRGGIFSLPWHAMGLAIDPNNENKVLAGGLELYVLNDVTAGSITDLDWIQLANWWPKFEADEPGLSQEEIDALLAKYVHADIHDIQFIGNSSDEVIITTDGGVFHSSNVGLTNSIDPENPVQEFPVFGSSDNALNTTQFYHGALHPEEGRMEVLGGTQDNGTIHQIFKAGEEMERYISGGDGGYSFFDKDNSNLKITMVYGNRYFIHVDDETYFYGIPNGLFVNPVDYDEESNLLYSNTATSSYGGLIAGLAGAYYDTLEILNVNKFLSTPDLGLDTISFIKLNMGVSEAITAIKLVKNSDPLDKTLIIGTENGKI